MQNFASDRISERQSAKRVEASTSCAEEVELDAATEDVIALISHGKLSQEFLKAFSLRESPLNPLVISDRYPIFNSVVWHKGLVDSALSALESAQQASTYPPLYELPLDHLLVIRHAAPELFFQLYLELGIPLESIGKVLVQIHDSTMLNLTEASADINVDLRGVEALLTKAALQAQFMLQCFSELPFSRDAIKALSQLAPFRDPMVPRQMHGLLDGTVRDCEKELLKVLKLQIRELKAANDPHFPRQSNFNVSLEYIYLCPSALVLTGDQAETHSFDINSKSGILEFRDGMRAYMRKVLIDSLPNINPDLALYVINRCCEKIDYQQGAISRGIFIAEVLELCWPPVRKMILGV